MVCWSGMHAADCAFLHGRRWEPASVRTSKPQPTQPWPAPFIAQIATRVEGAELLEQALREGRFDSDGELISEGEGEEGVSEDEGSDAELSGSGSDGEEQGEEADEGQTVGGGLSDGAEEEDGSDSEGWSTDEEEGEEGEEGDEEGGSSSEGEEGVELGSDEEDGEQGGSGSGSDSEGEDEEAASSSGGEGEEEAGEGRRRAQRQGKRGAQAAAAAEQAEAKRPKKAPQQGSIAQLKKQLAAAKGGDEAAAAEGQDGVPLEWGRILTEEDFEKIRQLKHRRLVESAMQVRAGARPTHQRRLRWGERPGGVEGRGGAGRAGGAMQCDGECSAVTVTQQHSRCNSARPKAGFRDT